MITVYTDGACLTPPGHGGWAWWVHDHLYDSGAVSGTTSNQMEMKAMIEALTTDAIDPAEPLIVVSDSLYVINGFVKGWLERWQSNGWMNADRKPVANQGLWRALLKAYEDRPGTTGFKHCRGHRKGGVEDAPHVHGNEQADRLAVMARKMLH